MFMNAKLEVRRQEVLEALTLCKPLNKTLGKFASMRLSINEIKRPRDVLGVSTIMNMSQIIKDDGFDFNDDFEEEDTMFRRDTRNGPNNKSFASKFDFEGQNPAKSMYFTYEDQMEINMNRRLTFYIFVFILDSLSF